MTSPFYSLDKAATEQITRKKNPILTTRQSSQYLQDILKFSWKVLFHFLKLKVKSFLQAQNLERNIMKYFPIYLINVIWAHKPWSSVARHLVSLKLQEWTRMPSWAGTFRTNPWSLQESVCQRHYRHWCLQHLQLSTLEQAHLDPWVIPESVAGSLKTLQKGPKCFLFLSRTPGSCKSSGV